MKPYKEILMKDDKYSGKCEDQLKKDCGKIIDDLKKNIQETNVLPTIKNSVDLAECVVSHLGDLTDSCKLNEDASTLMSSLNLEQPKIYFSVEKHNIDIDIKECIDLVNEKCSNEINQCKEDIEDFNLFKLAQDTPKLAQCVADIDIKGPNKCVEITLDLVFNAMKENKHHFFNKKAAESSLKALSGEFDEDFRFSKDEKPCHFHSHLHSIFSIVFILGFGFFCFRKVTKTCSRCRARNQNNSTAAIDLEYQPMEPENDSGRPIMKL